MAKIWWFGGFLPRLRIKALQASTLAVDVSAMFLYLLSIHVIVAKVPPYFYFLLMCLCVYMFRCMYTCAYRFMCMFVCMHMEARGQCWLFSSVTLYLIF